MTPEQIKKYKEVIKEAKERGVNTIDELSSLVGDVFVECTGADFEYLKDCLKIKRF